MKVCMVSYSFYESDNRVMRYAETLAARGDEVDVISLRKPGQEEAGTLHGVRVTRIQSRARNEKGKLTYLIRILSFWFRSMLLLSWRHLQKPYDFVHVHSVPDFMVFTAWVPKLCGTKVVLDIHDILPEFYASKFKASHDCGIFKAMVLVERLSAAFADHVIIANDLWHKRLIERGIHAKKLTSIVNTPDLSVFTRQGRTRKGGKLVLIYPGTLNWHQGVDIAIRAIAVVKDKLPNLEFHIYGEGESHSGLMLLAKELGLEDRVRFYDPLPIREIAHEIEEADLGVVAKRADSFGDQAFSTKILEFMCMGVPAIVSGTSIDRYYFNESVVQFFRSGDVEDLARCILMLASDTPARLALADRAREFAYEMTWDVNKAEYLRLVDSLVGGLSWDPLPASRKAKDAAVQPALHASQGQ